MATAPTTPPSIAALSTPPNRATDSQTDFSNKADAFLSDLPNFGTQQNALASWENTTATQVYNNAVEANASADSANLAKTAALGAANYVGIWSSLSGAYSAGISVFHNGVIWALLVNTSNIAATTPSSANTNWEQVSYEITQSATDTTAGRLLKVGDFGVGGQGALVSDLSAIGDNGFYAITGSDATSSGSAPTKNAYEVIHIEYDGNSAKQIAWMAGSSTVRHYERVKSGGTWGPWQELYHSGNNPSSLGTTSGYQKLASGMIIQWAKVSTTASDAGSNFSAITFPIAFTNACVSVVGSAERNVTDQKYVVATDNLTTTSVDVYVYQVTGGTSTTEVQIIAIGY